MANEKEVYEEMLNEIGAGANASGDVAQQAFTQFFIEFLVEKVHFVADFIPCFFNQIFKSARARINAYYLDEQTHDLTILVSDFVCSEEITTIGLTEIKDIFKQARRFYAIAPISEFRNSVKGFDEVETLANLIYDNSHVIKRVRYILVTNRKLGNRVKEIDFDELKQSANIASEFTVWDFNRYYDVITSLNPPSEIEVDCCPHSESGKGLPYLTLSSVGLKYDATSPEKKVREYSAYLLMVPDRCIYDWYATYSDRLLEQNVRTFLQFKGKVNRGIRQTIMAEPNRFLAYNNGITATAEEVVIKNDRIVLIKGLQIVNGGQTTASIYTALNAKEATDIDAIAVQMKLIVIPVGNVDEMVAKISRFANSQNKIKDTDLASNQRFMLRMESFSRNLTANPEGSIRGVRWFFERTRGQYANSINVLKTEVERNRFKALYPKDNVFTKPDLAKFILSWDLRPWIVARGGEKAFLEFSSSKHLFGSDNDDLPGVEIVPSWKFSDSDSNPQFSELYYKELIGKAILYRIIDKALRNCNWCKGYKSQIVTYTLSVFHKIICNCQLSFNFELLWANQTVPKMIIEYLLFIAMTVSDVMQATANGRNVAEWAKIEELWYRMIAKFRDYILPDEIKQFCYPQQLLAIKRNNAISEQKKRNGAELLILLNNTEDSVFIELKSWIMIRQFSVSYAERDALATRISRKNSMIGSDAIKLMKMWQRAAKNGFMFTPPEE